jgi:hypothetical protein
VIVIVGAPSTGGVVGIVAFEPHAALTITNPTTPSAWRSGDTVPPSYPR